MPKTQHPTPNPIPEQLPILFDLLRWVPISCAVGILAGSASALLLWSLDLATRLREAHLWLILLLAPAGALVGLLYRHFGASVERGNNLILDEIHSPSEVIPLRMTPLILLGTFLTHLFGGSAGREGTALQTGASLADQLSKPLRLTPPARRILLMAGIAAGFGSVFGTPLAGAIFGLEVLAIGRLSYDAIFPCLLSAFIGDLVCKAWHIHHTVYTVTDVPVITLPGIGYAMLAGIAFGLMGMAFARLTHAIGRFMRSRIAYAPLRPFLGGLVVTLAVFTIGTAHTAKFLGLGIPTIQAAFTQQLPPYDFAAKTLFTAVTLGSGFKGGEVTPLFYIGATLGNALSHLIPLPTSLLAGMGFVAVFAGAANTPIASTLMAVELFGGEAGAYAAIACVLSYLFSGHAGIYSSQRIGQPKYRVRTEENQNYPFDAIAGLLGAFSPRDYAEEALSAGEQAGTRTVQSNEATGGTYASFQTQTVSAPPSPHFDNDPEDKLPVMTLEELTQKLSDSRSDFNLAAGQRIRIRIRLTTDDVVGRDSIFLIRSPALFLQERFHIEMTYGTDLRPFDVGQTVEIICVFRQVTVINSERSAGEEWYFSGQEIQPVN